MGHLDVLIQVLDVARAGLLFPDARRVREWLVMVRGPWAGKSVPKVELEPGSGFPSVRSHAKLLRRQQLAKAFFAAHRTRPQRGTDQFNAALAAAELWEPRTVVKVMSAQQGSSRLLVVHDRFDAARGTPLRFTIQLEQQGTRHVKVSAAPACTPSGPFIESLSIACDDSATACAVRLQALEGIKVLEAVRGELGPCVTAFNAMGPLGELTKNDGDGVLSLLLERVGETVTADFTADAWPAEDPHASKRASHGWHLARERKLVCTPGVESALKTLAARSRMLVRSR